MSRIIGRRPVCGLALVVCLGILAERPAFAQDYWISGSPDSLAPFVVDDALDVDLNGAQFYTDGPAASGARQPIPLPLGANVGDTLRFRVRDTFGNCASLSTLFLIDAQGRSAVIDPGFVRPCSPSPGALLAHDYTTTIPDLSQGYGAEQVADIRPGPASSAPTSMAVFNDALYFAANDGTHGRELWRLRRGALAPELVDDIVPGPLESGPARLTVAGNALYFIATTPATGAEVFRYDGVSPPAVAADIHPGPASSLFTSAFLTPYGDEVFVSAWDGVAGGDDLFAVGPNGLRAFNLSPDGSNPHSFAVHDGVLYFSAATASHGGELWAYDGGAAPVRVTDIVPGSGSSNPGGVMKLGNKLIFSASNAFGQRNLHVFEGGVDTEINPSVALGGFQPGGFVRMNNVVYFTADDGLSGRELWLTDGTANGTRLVADVYTGPQGSNYRNLTPFGGELVFGANDPASGFEIRATNGFVTRLVADVAPGAAHSAFEGAFPFANAIFFVSPGAGTTLDPWVTNGTSTGTRVIRKVDGTPINPAGDAMDDTTFTLFDGSLYFAGNDGNTGFELWRIRLGASPATAQPQVVATDEDVDLAITLSGSGGSGPLSFAIASGPANGLLSGTPPSIMYEPAPDYAGSDSFTFTVNDGSGPSAPATVFITVNPVNDPPVAVDDDAGTTVEDTAIDIAAATLVANDTDVDGGALSISSVGFPMHGAVVLNAGVITFTPAPDYNGVASFEYTVVDGNGGSDTGLVTVTVTPVNDAPRAVADTYAVTESTPLTIPAPGVLGNDVDPDGDALSAVLQSPPLPQHGALTLNADGSFSFIPVAGFSGQASFSYRATDGVLTSFVTTVTLNVSAVDDPPTAVDDSYTTPANTPLTIAAPGVLLNDSDPDSTALTAALVTGPAHGVLTLNADGSFTYTPNAGYTGSDAFTYEARDLTSSSNAATVAITVTASQAPTAGDDSYSTSEDTPLTVPAPGVLNGDSDPENDPLTAILVAGPVPSQGALVLNANGSFVFSPAANFAGTATFTYKANDGQSDSNVATVSIVVTPVNDPPNAVDDSATVAEDSGTTAIAVLANDSDVDGDPLTITGVTQPAGGVTAIGAGATTITFTPNADANGLMSFTYTISDGQGGTDTATVSVTVTPVNDAPVAVAESYTTAQGAALSIPAPGVLANDTDIDSTGLTAVLVAGPANGALTLAPNGSFTYTPNASFAGTDTFTYVANDGAASSNAVVVTITVTPAATVPAAPASLAANAVSATRINLTWSDNSTNENGFSIERCQGNGNCMTFVVLAQVGANVTTFADTSVSASTRYTYRVRAFNSIGPSPYSNVARERTPK